MIERMKEEQVRGRHPRGENKAKELDGGNVGLKMKVNASEVQNVLISTLERLAMISIEEGGAPTEKSVNSDIRGILVLAGNKMENAAMIIVASGIQVIF